MTIQDFIEENLRPAVWQFVGGLESFAAIRAELAENAEQDSGLAELLSAINAVNAVLDDNNSMLKKSIMRYVH